MEEANQYHDQYLMWMQRRKQILMMNSINCSSSPSPSWEEKGFSEDLRAAAGSPGGCVWPPRSYTCSFCMREFKSAQALGGHMNIHRRDKARLNQYYCLPGIPHNSTEISEIHDNHEYSSLKLDHQINSRPSSSTNNISKFLSPNYSSRVSDEQPFVSSTNFSDHHHDRLSISKRVMLDLEKNPRKLSEDGFVETDLCVGLNISVVGENNRPKTTFSSESSLSPTGFCRDHHEHETGNFKRPKLMSFFLKPCRLQSNQVTHEVSTTEVAGNSRDDDLDLELRLGEPPKVK